MVRKSDLTLNSIKERARSGGTYQISDFMTSEEKLQLRHANWVGRRKKRKFDEVDFLAAEIMGRFGYSAYCAWNAGELSTNHILRLLEADRAREKASLLNLEAIVMAMVGSCIQRPKGSAKPKGVKLAEKIYKSEIKAAKGEK